jgi:outer membrane receptor protein involved in Fe transport
VFFGDTVYNVVVGGADLTRFKQETDAWVVSGSYVNQTNRDHQIKLGGEAQFPRMRFGAPGYLKVAAVGIDFERPPVSPEFPGVSTYRPLLGAAYVQDDVEWNDLKLRAGLRLDYFDARSTLPGDLRNPADALDVTGDLVPDTLPPRATTVKLSVSPRLGVSYPISERAAIYFAYGHFYQMPPLRDVFTNANYQRLAGLAAGTGDKFGVLGNPDIRPERTVQYQLGYKDMLSDVLGLDLNVYYKDIRDLIGVEFVSTYNDAQYARMTNVDFGSVFGFTLALDRRPVGLLSWALDYTWQLARGNSSEPNETFTRAQGNLDPRPRQMPLNWDQRHTLNLTLTLARPERFSASAIVRVASGQPYTPEIATYGGGLESNSGRKPSAVLVDLRAERNLKLGTAGVGAFARVFNVFDQRYLNGVVFANSGSPYYSRTPTFDQAALADPTRLYAPRRVEVGLSFGGGAQR